MDKEQAKHLLMKPLSEEHLGKVLESINRKPRPVVLKPSSSLKIVHKIIAYEYLTNNFVVDEDTIEMLRQDNDGVWVSYFGSCGLTYAKVWFTSGTPDLREIFKNVGEK